MKAFQIVLTVAGLVLSGAATGHIGVHAEGVVHPSLGLEHLALLAAGLCVSIWAGMRGRRGGG